MLYYYSNIQPIIPFSKNFTYLVVNIGKLKSYSFIVACRIRLRFHSSLRYLSVLLLTCLLSTYASKERYNVSTTLIEWLFTSARRTRDTTYNIFSIYLEMSTWVICHHIKQWNLRFNYNDLTKIWSLTKNFPIPMKTSNI